MEKKETTYPKVTLCDTTYIPDYEEYKEIVRQMSLNHKVRGLVIFGISFPRVAL